MAGEGGAKAPPPQGGSGMTWMFIMLLMMFIVLSPSVRNALGMGMSYVMDPLVGLHGLYPMWSILLGSIIIVIISQVIRHLMTDWVHLAKDQKYMTAFNKELTEARKNGNAQRMQKLMEMQPEVMMRQMDVQAQTMKPTVFTMVVFVAFITWIYVFTATAVVRTISLPWEDAWPLLSRAWMPYSVVLYMLFSIVLGQVVINTLKYITFTRRLRALDAGAADADEHGEASG